MKAKSRPNIGVTAATERVSYGVWKEIPAIISPARYLQAVQRAGGRPVLLPPDPEDAEDPGEVLDLLDALVVTGGAGDLDPALYREERHPETGPVQEERDAYELALVRGALEREMPVLGICRGMQILNLAYGGTIEQHLPDVLGHEEHRHTPGTFADHEVRLVPDSLSRINGRGWVVEMCSRVVGWVHPLEKSAPSFTDISIHRLYYLLGASLGVRLCST